VSTVRDYDANPFVPEQADLDRLAVHVDPSGGWIDINGPCPRCTHFVHFVIPEREFSPYAGGDGSPKAAVASEPNLEDAALDVQLWQQPHEHAAPHHRKPRHDDRTIVLQCNCATTHLDAHSHKRVDGGCGAWFSVTLPHAKHPKLYRGPAFSLYEENNALERGALAENELARVRNAAGGWTTGLAGLVALIPTLVVVKGTDTVDKLARSDAIVVGVLVAAGAVSAIAATLLALRAANGPLTTWRMTSDDLRPFREEEVDKTIACLRAARWTTVFAAAALAAAIAYAWAAPTAPPPAYVSLTLSNGTSVCGTPAGADSASARVQTANGETIAYSLADVKSATFVPSC
jgi:hypothetical protein